MQTEKLDRPEGPKKRKMRRRWRRPRSVALDSFDWSSQVSCHRIYQELKWLLISSKAERLDRWAQLSYSSVCPTEVLEMPEDQEVADNAFPTVAQPADRKLTRLFQLKVLRHPTFVSKRLQTRPENKALHPSTALSQRLKIRCFKQAPFLGKSDREMIYEQLRSSTFIIVNNNAISVMTISLIRLRAYVNFVKMSLVFGFSKNDESFAQGLERPTRLDPNSTVRLFDSLNIKMRKRRLFLVPVYSSTDHSSETEKDRIYGDLSNTHFRTTDFVSLFKSYTLCKQTTGDLPDPIKKRSQVVTDLFTKLGTVVAKISSPMVGTSLVCAASTDKFQGQCRIRRNIKTTEPRAADQQCNQNALGQDTEPLIFNNGIHIMWSLVDRLLKRNCQTLQLSRSTWVPVGSWDHPYNRCSRLSMVSESKYQTDSDYYGGPCRSHGLTAQNVPKRVECLNRKNHSDCSNILKNMHGNRQGQRCRTIANQPERINEHAIKRENPSQNTRDRFRTVRIRMEDVLYPYSNHPCNKAYPTDAVHRLSHNRIRLLINPLSSELPTTIPVYRKRGGTVVLVVADDFDSSSNGLY
ncbi:hypothetical protein CLF_106608, partial [Clonorchis sinensis]